MSNSSPHFNLEGTSLSVVDIERASARETLREGTDDLHRLLDTMPFMARLLETDVSVGDYHAVLGVLMQWYGQCERMLVDVLAEAADHAHEQQQLLQLDLNISAHNAFDTKTLRSTAAGWGAYYVMVGSSLGSVMISRHLKMRFSDGQTLAYYASAAARARSFAGDFLPRLEQALADQSSRADAIHGARIAFQMLIDLVRISSKS